MLSRLKTFLLKAWAQPSPKERDQALGKTGARFYLGTRAMSRIVWALLGLTILFALGFGIWKMWGAGGTEAVIHKGDEAPKVQVEPPFLENSQVPVGTLDTLGNPVLERIEVERPDEVEAAISVGREGKQEVLIRDKEVWFPEFKSPGEGTSVQVLGPDSIPVTVTPRPRSFLEFDPSPVIGAGVVPSDTAGGLSVYVGADLVRAGPLHGQVGVTGARRGEGFSGMPLDFAPGVGIEAREDLMLNGAYKWNEGKLYFGVSYKF